MTAVSEKSHRLCLLCVCPWRDTKQQGTGQGAGRSVLDSVPCVQALAQLSASPCMAGIGRCNMVKENAERKRTMERTR